MNRKQKLFSSILFSGLATLGFFAFTLIVQPSTASAATFIVDSTADTSDDAPGDGDCETAGGVCTLRAALEETGDLDGADTINFNIPGAGVHTITPGSTFPSIQSGSLTIDASTQPGANCGTLVPDDLPASNTPHTLLIELDGQNMNGPAIVFSGQDGDEYALRGLALNNVDPSFTDYSVYASGDSFVTIECNYFGTNAGGDTISTDNTALAINALSGGAVIQNNLFAGFSFAGFQTSAYGTEVAGNLIGTDASGTAALSNGIGAQIRSNGSQVTNNVVAGNENDGLEIVTDTTLTGNYIGVGVDGSPLGNGGDGVEFSSGATDYVAGGSDIADRNVISANGESGVHIYNLIGSSCVTDNTDSVVQGNYIGTSVTGEVADGYGNGASGIEVNEQAEGDCGGGSIFRHQIGGPGNGEANIIAGNTADGIRVYDAEGTDVFGISMIQNKIYSNGNLGINLAADPESTGEATEDVGPNPLNDLLIEYPSDKANNYLNAPEIDYFSLSDNKVNIHYDFNAPEVVGGNEGETSLQPSDLVGYRLDFYVNEAPTDGAYEGYSQAQEYLGGFIVDGDETDASHEFSNGLNISEDSIVTATATVLWRTLEAPECVEGVRTGSGPPYELSQDLCD